jgi:hypothetical protein
VRLLDDGCVLGLPVERSIAQLPFFAILYRAIKPSRLTDCESSIVTWAASTSFALLADVKEAIDFIPMLKELDTSPLVLTGVTEANRKAITDVFFVLTGFAFMS